jgi:hypothetical protein
MEFCKCLGENNEHLGPPNPPQLSDLVGHYQLVQTGSFCSAKFSTFKTLKTVSKLIKIKSSKEYLTKQGAESKEYMTSSL